MIINGDVGDKSFKLLSGFCQFVKRIEINNGGKIDGGKITDESLTAFCRLEYLSSLTLWFSEVSDQAVIELLDKCKVNTNTFLI